MGRCDNSSPCCVDKVCGGSTIWAIPAVACNEATHTAKAANTPCTNCDSTDCCTAHTHTCAASGGGGAATCGTGKYVDSAAVTNAAACTTTLECCAAAAHQAWT